MDHWNEAAAELLPDMIRMRRAIHAEPEIGLQNPLTTAKARAALEGLPLEIVEGGATTGFVATLRGPENGRTVLLRADMDALPMPEETGLAFASRHANARSIKVSGVVDFDRGWISIADDGRGFDKTQVPEGHYGLLGMKERADKIGGRLDVETGPRGTVISIEWSPR